MDELGPDDRKEKGSFLLEVLDGSLPTTIPVTDTVRRHYEESVKQDE